MNNLLKIHSFPTGSYGCNCSIIYSEETKEAIAVDPGDNEKEFLTEVEKLGVKIKYLLHTHAHFDHIGGSKKIKDLIGAPICLHKSDELLYKALPLQSTMFGRPPMLAGTVDHYLQDEEEFFIESDNLKHMVKTLFTPGHTGGSCCFYTEALDTPVLFSGDTLFQGSIGRTDLPGGNLEEIKKSIKVRLYDLPEDTIVIPGHGMNTQIFQEKRNNPFVRG